MRLFAQGVLRYFSKLFQSKKCHFCGYPWLLFEGNRGSLKSWGWTWSRMWLQCSPPLTNPFMIVLRSDMLCLHDGVSICWITGRQNQWHFTRTCHDYVRYIISLWDIERYFSNIDILSRCFWMSLRHGGYTGFLMAISVGKNDDQEHWNLAKGYKMVVGKHMELQTELTHPGIRIDD